MHLQSDNFQVCKYYKSQTIFLENPPNPSLIHSKLPIKFTSWLFTYLFTFCCWDKEAWGKSFSKQLNLNSRIMFATCFEFYFSVLSCSVCTKAISSGVEWLRNFACWTFFNAPKPVTLERLLWQYFNLIVTCRFWGGNSNLKAEVLRTLLNVLQRVLRKLLTCFGRILIYQIILTLTSASEEQEKFANPISKGWLLRHSPSIHLYQNSSAMSVVTTCYLTF